MDYMGNYNVGQLGGFTAGQVRSNTATLVHFVVNLPEKYFEKLENPETITPLNANFGSIFHQIGYTRRERCASGVYEAINHSKRSLSSAF